jgi:hypothetical protein
VQDVSSSVAADLQSSGFAAVRDSSSESAQLRAKTAREVGIRSRLVGPAAGKAAMAKLVPVVVTALAIFAGPVVASLVESRLPPPAQYNSGFQLRGSIAFMSDLRLRGSIR